MPSDFLLEIGVEEIPASMVLPALDQLETGLLELCQRHRLDHGEITTYGTPRRLAVLLCALADRQQSTRQEVRGPKAEVAFDAEGKPTRAAEGFARSKGVPVESLEVRETDKGAFAYAVFEDEGLPALELLARDLPSLVLGLSFPKSMRWANTTARFARPLRWLVALLGEQVVPFEIEGVRSGRQSRGHRFLCRDPVPLASPHGYLDALRAAHVIADHRERRELIRTQVAQCAADAGAGVRWDEDLLTEVSFLVEFPTAFVGEFEPDFLALPDDVLVTVLEGHQKYFALEAPDGNLVNKFVAVRNGDEAHLDTVRTGAERVVRPRLADARFYFERDRRRPLQARLEDLERVTYIQGLGSLLDKTHRLEHLVAILADQLTISDQDRAAAQRAARLSKCDLVTDMVLDFASLQGRMGGEYARLDGEPEPVWRAIREHYQPGSAGAAIPSTGPGRLLSLADKLDNLAACFSQGLLPRGTADPYALRRQAQGILSIILEADWRLALPAVLEPALAAFPAPAEYPKNTPEDYQPLAALHRFFLQRLDAVLDDAGIAYDLRRAVLAAPCPDLLAAYERAVLLGDRRKSDTDFEPLCIAATRVANIVRPTDTPDDAVCDPDALVEPSEQALHRRFAHVAQICAEALDGEPQWPTVWLHLTHLREPIDRFFDDVLVMTDDDALRHNRLALLRSLDNLFLRVADFTQVVIE